MDAREQRYLEAVEAFTEAFLEIQRRFILEQHGVQAIIRFIEDFSGGPTRFNPEDPVLKKGRGAAEGAVAALERESTRLREARPPIRWRTFHRLLRASLRTQLRGYREMLEVFQDADPAHIERGHALIEEGMQLLAAGARGPAEA